MNRLNAGTKYLRIFEEFINGNDIIAGGINNKCSNVLKTCGRFLWFPRFHGAVASTANSFCLLVSKALPNSCSQGWLPTSPNDSSHSADTLSRCKNVVKKSRQYMLNAKSPSVTHPNTPLWFNPCPFLRPLRLSTRTQNTNYGRTTPRRAKDTF